MLSIDAIRVHESRRDNLYLHFVIHLLRSRHKLPISCKNLFPRITYFSASFDAKSFSNASAGPTMWLGGKPSSHQRPFRKIPANGANFQHSTCILFLVTRSHSQHLIRIPLTSTDLGSHWHVMKVTRKISGRPCAFISSINKLKIKCLLPNFSPNFPIASLNSFLFATYVRAYPVVQENK